MKFSTKLASILHKPTAVFSILSPFQDGGRLYEVISTYSSLKLYGNLDIFVTMKHGTQM